MTNNQLVFVTKRQETIIAIMSYFLVKKRLLSLFCKTYILKSMSGVHHHHKAQRYNFIVVVDKSISDKFAKYKFREHK